ncbi:DNA-processing protein DprA [Paenibacillus sp. 481]|uniref:DNA-processing protein DprA n=1 Tax=Paenibacillus sp. 481 TaxID=2835869 RepID=UPI001E2B9102|nr:DNA-processing protein DprA [Paenibacillus sp. 481]UHA73947.1 DNA-processing protein DprA [Paenibacillus sp. 481]
MSEWTERELLFGLHETEGIGWHTIQMLSERVGFANLSAWLNRPAADWIHIGIKPAQAAKLAQQYDADRLAARLHITQQQGIEWITMLDHTYPELLKQTHEPPWIMYGRGNWDVLRQPCVAIVGTRTPTVYGKTIAYQLSEQLAEAGITVVSGLARGIDGSSHEGAIKKGMTVAVLGTPLDRVYPPEHRSLFHAIAEGGLVVSEYPLGTRSHPGLFPRRNRIIAGLALGTVVVEAAVKSGALITADLALDASREVFAVPGPVTSPKSEGTFYLLQQGAKPVACAADIIEEFASWLTTLPLPYNNGTVATSALEPLLEEEATIVQLLSLRSLTFDELLAQSGLPFAKLHQTLLSLQLKKRIREAPGAQYCSEWM